MNDEPVIDQDIQYDDNYQTCKKTYATYRLYHLDLNPNEITKLFGMQPTASQIRGERYRKGAVTQMGGWFLSSKEHIRSKDSQRHISWLLDQLNGKEDLLRKLRDEGYEMDISCYWLSAYGHAGPHLSASIMKRLGHLEMNIWFDVYMGDEKTSE